MHEVSDVLDQPDLAVGDQSLGDDHVFQVDDGVLRAIDDQGAGFDLGQVDNFIESAEFHDVRAVLGERFGLGVAQVFELSDDLAFVALANLATEHFQNQICAAGIVALVVKRQRAPYEIFHRCVGLHSKTAEHQVLNGIWPQCSVRCSDCGAPGTAGQGDFSAGMNFLYERMQRFQLFLDRDVRTAGFDLRSPDAWHVEDDDGEVAGESVNHGAPDRHGLHCAADTHQEMTVVPVLAVRNLESAGFQCAFECLHSSPWLFM